MTHWLAIIGKGIVIGVCAAVAATAFVALIVPLLQPSDGSGAVSIEAYTLVGSVALMGSLLVGLPVALLTYWFAGPHLLRFSSLLPQITVLASIMLVLSSAVIGGRGGMLFFGAPAVTAAATYGILGWFWILRPLRNSLNNPPQEKEIA